MSSEKHLFAIHAENISNKVSATDKGSMLELRDEHLWTRIVRVLRLAAGETIILFDQFINIEIRLEEQTMKSKNRLFITIISYKTNKVIKPELVLYQCLPQKPVFEEIIYTATQMGVTTVHPLITSKVQRKWGEQRELDRLSGISFSACEQSKNFIPCLIAQPMAFNAFLESSTLQASSEKSAIKKIFFDGQGAPLLSLLQELDQHKISIKKIMVVVGPEGGLTTQEMDQLKLHGFEACALTSTVLRAKDAVMVGLASIRSVI